MNDDPRQDIDACQETKAQEERLQLVADEFNARYPIGTKVTRYKLIDPLAEPVQTVTRSTAWVMGGHSVVVKVEGTAGGVILKSITIGHKGKELKTLYVRKDNRRGTNGFIAAYGLSPSRCVFGYGKTEDQAKKDALKAANTKRGKAYLEATTTPRPPR